MESPEVRQREELMEARRLRRMEQAHRRKFQQRLVLLILCVILALSAVLILRGCRSRQAQQDTPAAAQADDFSQLGVETEPDIVFTLADVGDITVDDEQLAAALQEDGSYDFTESFAAVSGLTSAADLTLGNLECTFAGQPYSGVPDFRTPESLAATLQAVGFDVLQTVTLMAQAQQLEETAGIETHTGARGFRNTPVWAEHLLTDTEKTTVFTGNAKEAIATFPRRVNVAVATSLATTGPEITGVTMHSVPNWVGDDHRITAEIEGVKAVVDICSSTSAIAGWSAVSLLRNLSSPVCFY